MPLRQEKTRANVRNSISQNKSQAPPATYRIKGDGNFFFSEAYVAHVLTGSQDDNKEVRLLVTSYMAHSFMISEVACILDPS